MKKRALLAAALMTVGAAVTPASAATITQERVINTDGNADPIISDFDLFDGTGTLTDVILSWELTGQGGVTAGLCLTFQDCEPGLFTLNLTGTGVFSGASDSDSDGSGITNSLDIVQTGSVLATIDNSFSFNNLNLFQGSGQANGTVEVATIYSGFPNELNLGANSLTGTVTLSYVVNQVPVPAALPLVLSGLALFGIAARRRRMATA
ncbi:hypothetical protein KHP62_07800 [Rhodobacteraceae bacterium NNCM2]|nr:hypothetical protein [Coraliihabitans acroporae]